MYLLLLFFCYCSYLHILICRNDSVYLYYTVPVDEHLAFLVTATETKAARKAESSLCST
ncbi:Uncharacterized protein APZ42_021023 [Daphnia magna]|uniref:Uncharacterized protein n=1 Tax=Daphnia magna TaxID=35525 RepID=A0A0P5D2W8_9CRUS|nr:Uncharacterized protein APZ42_021023 [Daphnia magna]